MNRAILSASAILLAVLFVGCASKGATESGRNTMLDGFDLVEMTDRMARSIAEDPEVAAEIARRGTLRVVVLPAENHMRGEVMPTGAAYAFTARVRTLLQRSMPDRFEFILNREAFYSKRRELEGLDLGPAPDAVDPEYALVARFYSITREDRAGRSADYLCAFELTDIDRRNVLWSDSYSTRKTVRRGSLD